MPRRNSRYAQRFSRLSLWILEGRDLPHGLSPLPDFGPASHVPGIDDHLDERSHFTLAGDVTMQAVGPFLVPSSQNNSPLIMNDIEFGGPEGPFAPTSITYTTNSAGLPLLNSSKTSPANIYLDFDGEGTNLPYDTNSDSTTFDAAEQSVIVEAWRQISVYYSMFDVNVTTVNPSGPKVWELISNSISGGYSYVNVFPNSTPRSFNQSSDARTRLSGIAHEVGHNFGLSHQSDYNSLGVKTNEYSSGWTMHGPIMGVDYAQNAHKFFWGHNSGSATTLQDDLAIVASKIAPYQAPGGDGYRPDEHGNTIAAATPTEGVNGYFRGWGVIERRTDVDAFSFTSTGGWYNVTANTDTPSCLNVKLEVYDAAGNRLATADGPNNDQLTSTSNYDRDLVMNLPAGTYYMMVSGHGDYSDLGSYDLSARPLPDGWSTAAIGTVIAGGYAGMNPTDGLWRVGGAGGDIWNTSDHFRFAYIPLTGNGSITARVVSIENTDTNAKAGVMIRESLAANSRNAFMLLKPSGAFYQYRSSTGGSTASVTGSGNAPYWVRLTRTGNSIAGQVSSDGTTWTTVSTQTVSMTSQVLIGLAVTSHNTSAVNVLNDSTFDNVTTTGTTGPTAPTYNALTAPTNVALTLGTGTGVNISWDAVAGATSYAVDRSPNGVTWTQVATPTATTYSDTGFSGGLRYFYRVAARDATGRSIESSVVSIINRPSAPTNVVTMSASTSTIVIDWRDAGGETGYRVERSSDSINWNTLATVGFNVPSYTNSGLTTNTTYQYRVIPLSVDGDGPASAVVTESTRLSAVTGLSFTSLASTSVGLQWNPMASVTGYRIERSTNGTTYSTLATVPVVNYVDTTVTQGNEYYYRVAALNAYSESSSMPIVMAATPASSKLPVPWDAQDVGTVGGAGTTKYGSSTFTLTGAGADIGGTADGVRLTSQLLVGDGSIVAKVTTLEDTGTNAEAGVMIRESTASNSRMVAVVLTPTSGARLITRSSTGGSATTTSVTGLAAPYWVRVDRSGNVFTAYTSSDGTTWATVGSPITISMTTNTRAGLAVSAGTTSLLNTSVFSNVTLTQGDIAPSVYSSTPTGRVAGPVSTIDLAFTEAMDTTSFNVAADVLSFTGPAGNLLPFITGFSWLDTQTLRLNLTAQSAPGDYSITFGPQILSATGQALDQNRDGVLGGASDSYTVSFRLGGVAADSGGYVYAATTYDASLNLNPTTTGVVAITAISNNDDAATAIDLGTNTFRIHSGNYSGANQLFVSSNGHITFGSSDTTSLNNDLTTPSVRAIFPLWDNLRSNQNTTIDDSVLYQFQDLNADSTPDQLVVSWRNLHYYSANNATDDGITFQAVLALNTGSLNGDITFNYVDLSEANTGATNNAGGASVGTKGTSASSRQVISQNSNATAEVGSGKAVRVFVNQSPTANAGGPYTLTSSNLVQLSAALSSDPDQSAASLTYLWDLDADGVFGETGLTATYGNETGMTPTFNALGLTGPSQVPIALRVVDSFGKVAVATGTTLSIPAPPTITNFAVNGSTDPQRSQIQSLAITFSQYAKLPQDMTSAFTLMGPGGPVQFSVSYVNSVATLNFTDLDDGQYLLTVLASAVTDSAGQELDGNGNQFGGDNAAFTFHRLFGDSDGNASVDQSDFIPFRDAFGNGPSLAFDLDHNNQVDQDDFIAFRNNFGATV